MGTAVSAWYIVFVKRDNQYWWDHIFCRGPYKHVLALGYDPKDDQWFMYDWSFLGLVLTKLSTDELDMLLTHFHYSDSVILKAPRQYKPYRQLCFPIATCVSAMKHLTRFKSWAITPSQLFCAYTKAGAKRSFVISDSNAEEANGRGRQDILWSETRPSITGRQINSAKTG
jgi:hypothetical protein